MDWDELFAYLGKAANKVTASIALVVIGAAFGSYMTNPDAPPACNCQCERDHDHDDHAPAPVKPRRPTGDLPVINAKPIGESPDVSSLEFRFMRDYHVHKAVLGI